MQYLNLLKYIPQYKKYKREKLLINFKCGVYEFLREYPKINVKESYCKRFYYDNKLKIIITLCYFQALKLGFSNYDMTLESALSYYQDNNYTIISISINDNKPRVHLYPNIEKFLSEIK
jgi:hypothetical protein